MRLTRLRATTAVGLSTSNAPQSPIQKSNWRYSGAEQEGGFAGAKPWTPASRTRTETRPAFNMMRRGGSFAVILPAQAASGRRRGGASVGRERFRAQTVRELHRCRLHHNRLWESRERRADRWYMR